MSTAFLLLLALVGIVLLAVLGTLDCPKDPDRRGLVRAACQAGQRERQPGVSPGLVVDQEGLLPYLGHVNDLKGDPLEEMAARLKLLVDGMDAMVLQADIEVLLSLRGK